MILSDRTKGAWALVLVTVGFGVTALLFRHLGERLALFQQLYLTFGAALVFGAPLKHALIGGVLQTLLWWTVFAYVLQVYLPTGSLFG